MSSRCLPSTGTGCFLHIIEDGGLDAAETEIEVRLAQQGTGKIDGRRIPLGRQAVDQHAARIGEPEQLGHLVEGLTGGVVQGPAQGPIAADAVDPVEVGVPSGDGQGQKGKGNLLFQMGRQDVPFHVMHADQGNPPGKGYRLGRRQPDQKRPDQPRTAGDGDPLDRRRATPPCSRASSTTTEWPQVLARGQFRDHPAVAGMDIHLGGDDIGQDLTAVAHNGRGGFVTGCFEAE